MEIKPRVLRIVRWEHFFLCLIVLITLLMHFAIITYPQDLILDEIHYVKDARVIISQHTTERQEHPPLAKLFVVWGIEAFGDNAWGWRVFPILFGTSALVMFYFLCRKLEMGRTGSNIATFLLAFENMTFVQNHVAMLDVYYVTIMIAAFLLYVSKRYLLAGVGIGLSALAKLNGALAAPVVFIHWLFSRRQKHSLWFALTAVFTVVTFVEFLILCQFLITRQFTSALDPFQLVKTMLQLSGTLKFSNVTHPALSYPWEWIINYKPMAFYVNPHYNSAISFTVWALTIPSFLYMCWKAWRRRSEAALFGVAWFFGTYLIWIPAILITDRVTYPYYFYPAVGAVCIGMALGMADMVSFFKRRGTGKLRWVAITFVALVIILHLFSFYILSPVFNYDYNWFFKPII
jgi:dolichyl-phosphate-mannose-protein mannosyltransferase